MKLKNTLSEEDYLKLKILVLEKKKFQTILKHKRLFLKTKVSRVGGGINSFRRAYY